MTEETVIEVLSALAPIALFFVSFAFGFGITYLVIKAFDKDAFR